MKYSPRRRTPLGRPAWARILPLQVGRHGQAIDGKIHAL